MQWIGFGYRLIKIILMITIYIVAASVQKRYPFGPAEGPLDQTSISKPLLECLSFSFLIFFHFHFLGNTMIQRWKYRFSMIQRWKYRFSMIHRWKIKYYETSLTHRWIKKLLWINNDPSMSSTGTPTRVKLSIPTLNICLHRLKKHIKSALSS